MNDSLLNLLHRRLPGRRVTAVRAGIGEINTLAFRADLLRLTSLYTTVRAEPTVKMRPAVFTNMLEHCRTAGWTMLLTVIDLCTTELTSLQFSVLQ